MSLLTCSLGYAQTGAPPKPPTPNQAAAAAYANKVCALLPDVATSAEATGLTPGEQDLAQDCLFLRNLPAGAFPAILGQQINALGPQTKKFGSLQQDNLTARLAELRHGVTGASIAGLVITDDQGRIVSNGHSQLSDFLPIGASGDDNGAWLDGRLGVFVNGDVQVGSKRASKNSFAFDIKDDSVTAGADYRVGQRFVFGAAYGSGKTTTDFANSLGRLDMTAKGVNLYGSFYGPGFYVDSLVGYGEPRLNTDRYLNASSAGSPGLGAIDQQAFGSTHLHDLWAGTSIGRPFDWGAFDLTPEGSLNYHEVRLSEFSETMSDPSAPGSGLALRYGNATVPSLQARAGLRGAYTLSTSWGVIQPDAHATWIREFRNHPDDFTTQFVNAPSTASGLWTTLQTDPPEGHYTAYGAGVLFQLAHRISGFFEYEELRTLKTIKSHEFSMGVRYQVGM
jgi:uncharacterized protein with beta-barrel porin domain